MTTWIRASSLVAMAVLVGCGPPPKSDSLSAWIYDDGAVVEVRASADPADAVIDAEWSITIENRVDEPCAVAVYGWIGDAFLTNLDTERPNASTPEAWSSTWHGAELLDSGLVDGMGSLVLGEAPIHAPARSIFGRFAIATCPDAALVMTVQIDTVVDYPQPWTSDRNLGVSLRQLD
jgi:hypothetical protein